MTKQTPMLLQAAFTIETLAHLQGHEELLPQAQFLRDLQAQLYRFFNATGDEERCEEEAALHTYMEAFT